MPALPRLPVAFAACALLAACAQTMDAPPAPLAGTWLVDGVYDSGTRLPTEAERQVLRHQAMRVTADQITDPLGRNCPDPTYEVRGTTAADWFGFGGSWLERRGPDVPLTAVTVLCGGRAFDGYALREDGALVGRYKDAYLVLRREDDPRVAERLPAIEQARYNRVISPGAAAAAPAPVVREATEQRREAPQQSAAAVPPPEVLGPTRADLAAREKATAAAPAAGGPAVHLASLRDDAGAAAEWASLQDRVPRLRDWAVRFEPVEIAGKGRFVRVLAVPPDGVDAAAACRALEKDGQYCRVRK
ncbi:hypothetical protein [Caenispirillum bisanense]|uniref:SPOR domain-containing protein n=1 Tax=Caenispirillum bisanense TaxID=414052 RepID=A0A286G8Z0_9PROT|nr:hypothetical protein [Caenispirillum bisanense]SOD92013.1 hypothetical protein SAMN05421508_102221 [Caenispirillum bisanense]